jgi:uracil phosphoribosyltransferase
MILVLHMLHMGSAVSNADCSRRCCCCCRHGSQEEEEVIYERLPSDIAERHVLLLDPLVGTGRTACRAVQVRQEAARW